MNLIISISFDRWRFSAELLLGENFVIASTGVTIYTQWNARGEGEWPRNKRCSLCQFLKVIVSFFGIPGCTFILHVTGLSNAMNPAYHFIFKSVMSCEFWAVSYFTGRGLQKQCRQLCFREPVSYSNNEKCRTICSYTFRSCIFEHLIENLHFKIG